MCRRKMYSKNTAEPVSDVAEPWSDCHTKESKAIQKTAKNRYEKEAVAKADGGCRCLIRVVNYKRRSAIQVEDELLFESLFLHTKTRSISRSRAFRFRPKTLAFGTC